MINALPGFQNSLLLAPQAKPHQHGFCRLADTYNTTRARLAKVSRRLEIHFVCSVLPIEGNTEWNAKNPHGN